MRISDWSSDVCSSDRQAASVSSFDEIRSRLLDRGATDGFVTDFGHMLSPFFRDPDGLEWEVCVPNPDARPDRKRAGRGRRGSVRVDRGGRHTIKNTYTITR